MLDSVFKKNTNKAKERKYELTELYKNFEVSIIVTGQMDPASWKPLQHSRRLAINCMDCLLLHLF